MLSCFDSSENAQSAVHLLNNTVFGPEYSRIQFSNIKVPERNIAYHAVLAAIGSEDYIAPKAAFAQFRQILSGLKYNTQSVSIQT